MRYHNRNLVRKKIVFVDKQGALKTKLSPMHPTVLFTQQFGLAILLFVAFFVFITLLSNRLKVEQQPIKAGVSSPIFEQVSASRE